MINNSGSHHIEINIYKTFNKMIPTFNCCSMITVFPKCPFTTLSLIKLLSRPSRNQFNRICDNIPFIASNCKKMNRFRSDCIIQYHQSVALFCFIQPLKPSTSILGKFQQKLSLMASVGDVPYLSGYIMSLGSRHYVICLYCPFHPQKERYRPKYWRCCGNIPFDINKLAWSDPDSTDSC